MVAFECFPRLPPELRLDIWQRTLQEEASSRPRVLFHATHHRVLPFKYLVSSMLSVNWEARSLALRFYDVRLRVWPVRLNSSLINRRRLNYLKYYRQHAARSYTGLIPWGYWGGLWGTPVENAIDNVLAKGAMETADPILTEGVVYLSTQYDHFVNQATSACPHQA